MFRIDFVHQGELSKMIFRLCLFLVLLNEGNFALGATSNEHDNMMERMKEMEVRDTIRTLRTL